MTEFSENNLVFSLKQDLVYLHRSLAEEWLFFLCLIKKVFAVDENSGLHKTELLKHDKSFAILVFKVNLSIEIAL